MRAGFGASDRATDVGGVPCIPRHEYRFVADPAGFELSDQMKKGVDAVTGEATYREPVEVAVLLQGAVPRMHAAFDEMGWSKAGVTVAAFAALGLLEVEVAAMRLYTGPMYRLYNTVLRAQATGGVLGPGSGFPDPAMHGASVSGRFTTTLHAINSGVVKLSRLQPVCAVFRGVVGMRLPAAFETADAWNVRGGVAHGRGRWGHFASRRIRVYVLTESRCGSGMGRERTG